MQVRPKLKASSLSSYYAVTRSLIAQICWNVLHSVNDVSPVWKVKFYQPVSPKFTINGPDHTDAQTVVQ
jgi:hypothetical protein